MTDTSPLTVRDPVNRLLLAEAAGLSTGPSSTAVVVIDDPDGQLTLSLLDLGVTHLRVHCDEVTAEREVLRAVGAAGRIRQVTAFGSLGPDVVRGAKLVLLHLPKSLAALREISLLVATHASNDVVLLAGGRVKHMTRSMNTVLAEAFDQVRGTLGIGKARGLVASRPARNKGSFDELALAAATLTDPELLAAAKLPPSGTLTVVARGGVFAGASLDLGTHALLRTASQWPEQVDAVLDLGCGTGILTTTLALRYPNATVVGADRSAAAVASTKATAEANGLASRTDADRGLDTLDRQPGSGCVVIIRDDAGDTLPTASFDLVVCNPPFHDRAAITTDTAYHMFAAAARLLRPGAEFWCVWNSHLRYRTTLNTVVGPTTQEYRDAKFTVTRSVRK